MNDDFAPAYGLTNSDMTTYGAEDMEELASTLHALGRADGAEPVEPWRRPGSGWERMLESPRRRLGNVASSEIPLSPGVIAIFDDERPVFVGEGAGKRGLRGRIQQHRATGTDLSSSTFRASVAVEVLGVSRWTARQRPSVLLQSMVDEVNEVVAEFTVAWIACSSADEARALKQQLWSEYKPEYNML